VTTFDKFVSLSSSANKKCHYK